MAPEQIDGGAITPATDIYALGIVIYEMLTGLLPFSADTPLATAMKRLSHVAPSPRLHIPDLDPRWEAVVARCLAGPPDQGLASSDAVRGCWRGDPVPPSARLPSAAVGPAEIPSGSGATATAA